MTGRDPAADAHTIAAAYLAELPDINLVELQDLDADVPLSLPDTVRAELRALAERLALALHPDTRIEHNDFWAPEHQRRLVTPWQPAPTTDSASYMEVKITPGVVCIHTTDIPDTSVVATHDEWRAFIADVKAGRWDVKAGRWDLPEDTTDA